MKQKLFAIWLVILLTFGPIGEASAQSYSFSLDREVVNVYWNSDGTMSLDYQFTFTNRPGAHVIDFVDVGLPNDNYNYNTITADVNGNPVSVSTDYQGSGSGVAIDLGSRAIQPGQTGTVHVYVGEITDVLHPDENDEEYASAVFSPTWFGSEFVVGNTDLTVTYHLPPGVKPEEPRWHSAPSGFPDEPQTGIDHEGRVTYTWSNPNASGSRQYTFGASFPKSYVPATAIVTRPAFDFGGLINTIVSSLGPLLCFGFFIFIFLGSPILAAIQGNRRKLKYMSPRIAIEGHGIKRGLTAVEAAVLMEQPLDKVMTMILFGTIKKGAAEVVTRDPLQLKLADPLPDTLHPYEKEFLTAFHPGSDARTRRGDLQKMMVGLIKSVSDKMKGFSRRETIDYYRNIMERAWQQVEQAATPEVKGQLYDQNLEWTMLDREYDDRTRRVFTGPIFVPMWWGRYDPTWRGAPTSTRAGGVPSAPSQGRGSTALPGADFAASVVGGVQTFSQKVIGNVNDFTSRVTNVTNPPPKPTSTGGHRGGRSGGCACACACAGCACACAGGGR
ncbi:MAG TPA: hypothetical protein VFZ43_00385 [Anaerolineales bacterium]